MYYITDEFPIEFKYSENKLENRLRDCRQSLISLCVRRTLALRSAYRRFQGAI